MGRVLQALALLGLGSCHHSFDFLDTGSDGGAAVVEPNLHDTSQMPGARSNGDEAISDAGTGPVSTASDASRGGGLGPLHRIAIGAKHVCVLPASGDRTVCFGSNEWGQLGNGTSTHHGTDPNPFFSDWSDVRESVVGASIGRPFLGAWSVVAGQFYTCAVRADDVFCWGYGIGVGTDAFHGIVNQAQGEPFEDVVHGRVLQLAGGFDHVCVLTEKGVFCTGPNTYGQVNPELPIDAVAITPVPIIAGARSLALGTHFSLALFDNGEVRCWGANGARQCGTQASVQCALNTTAPCVLTPGVIAGLPPSQAIVAGGAHACAIGVDQRLRCWGENTYGQLGVTGCSGSLSTCPRDPDVVAGVDVAEQIALGTQHSCALSGGRVRCWGRSDCVGRSYASLREVPDPVVVMREDGTELRNIVELVAASYYTCALDTVQDLYCWGDVNHSLVSKTQALARKLDLAARSDGGAGAPPSL